MMLRRRRDEEMEEEEEEEEGELEKIVKKLGSKEKLVAFLEGTDDIPEHVRKTIWSFSSRHLQLTNIKEKELPSYERRFRDLMRVYRWSTPRNSSSSNSISYFDEVQLKFLAININLRKSIGRGERELLATEIKKYESKEEIPSKGVRSSLIG
ncbi:MAG: hypothetical protein N3A69_18475, partial [Leptospiraceae bacterium]|nr:hypothetical protein [Leptospiraceae bacterium]